MREMRHNALQPKLTREALVSLLGLDRMAKDLHPSEYEQAELLEAQTCDGFQREAWRLQVEPDVWLPFWLLRPLGEGPFPLAVLPHGHGKRGRDIYAGITQNDKQKEWMLAEDRDIACQAVSRGFIAIAPTVRGFDELAEDDHNHRHQGWDCLSTFHHHLAQGRVLTGERVWDMMRLLDWACALPEINDSTVVMTGNSCGGMVTSYTAAIDTRITIASASCSFAAFVSNSGRMQHHGCNTVPGILQYGEFWDVLGLIAPRALQVIHGAEDDLFSREEVKRATDQLKEVFTNAGAADKFSNDIGSGGHRFYKNLLWPFIEKSRKH